VTQIGDELKKNGFTIEPSKQRHTKPIKEVIWRSGEFQKSNLKWVIDPILSDVSVCETNRGT
jgi:hypothetical protein